MYGLLGRVGCAVAISAQYKWIIESHREPKTYPLVHSKLHERKQKIIPLSVLNPNARLGIQPVKRGLALQRQEYIGGVQLE